MLYMVSDMCGSRIEEFVSQGGLFLTTYQSGIANESDLCFEGSPGPLRKILGIRCEETDVLLPSETISMIPEQAEAGILSGTGGEVRGLL